MAGSQISFQKPLVNSFFLERLIPCSFRCAKIFVHDALLFLRAVFTICLSVLQMVFRYRPLLLTPFEPNSVPLLIFFLTTLTNCVETPFFAQFLFVLIEFHLMKLIFDQVSEDSNHISSPFPLTAYYFHQSY